MAEDKEKKYNRKRRSSKALIYAPKLMRQGQIFKMQDGQMYQKLASGQIVKVREKKDAGKV